MKSLITSFMIIASLAVFTQAQNMSFTLLDKSTMTIDGTSNIHDWTCDVEQINSDIQFNASAFGQNPAELVKSLKLTIPVKKIESGKGGMNKKMYDALKEDEHPNITFRLTEASKSDQSGTNGSFDMIVDGRLTIAGVTKNVSVPVQAKKMNDGSFKFSGDYEIDMTNYEIEPPSALFGTVSAGKMVTVKFDLFVGS